jgi:hypothetical protein
MLLFIAFDTFTQERTTMTKQILLLSESGDADNGLTKTFAELTQNDAPGDTFNLRFFTTYNKARDPEGQQTKFQLTLDKDKADLFQHFLSGVN